MRNCAPIVASLICFFALLPLTVDAEIRAVKQYSIEQFLDTTAIRGSSFSHDGSKILISSDESGIFNAYALPVDGSKSIRLTASTTESIFARSYFPGDDRFIYEADQGGNELNHVYVQDPAGKVTDITPGEKLKARFAGWADDDQSFFVTSNERDPRYFDLYEVQVDGYQTSLIFKNETGYNVSSVSPDKRYIALSKVNTRADSDAFVYDRETGETRRLLEHAGDAVRSPQTFSRDGKSLYCLTDIDGEFRYLVKVDLETGESSVVQQSKWDVTYGRLSKKGTYITIGVNNDGRSEVMLHETKTRRRIYLPSTVPRDRMASVTFSPDEKAIAYYLQSGRSPSDLYYYRELSLRATTRCN